MIVPGTTLDASRLGLGTESLHRLGAPARADLLAAAAGAGIRYFDSAPLYGHGIAERELGRFIARGRAAAGSAPVVATKVGRVPNQFLIANPQWVRPQMVARALGRRIGAARAEAPQRFDPAWLRASLEGSLSRLGIDSVDIVYLHEPTRAALGDIAAVAAAMAQLKAAGKARHVGMSGRLEELLPIAAAHPELADVLQIDMAAGDAGADALRRAGRPMQVSFEHLRGPASDDAAACAAAQRFNPAGVVVLSTADRARLQEWAGRFDATPVQNG